MMYTAKWFSLHKYIFFFIFFSIIVYYKTLNTVPCWSVSYIVVRICCCSHPSPRTGISVWGEHKGPGWEEQASLSSPARVGTARNSFIQKHGDRMQPRVFSNLLVLGCCWASGGRWVVRAAAEIWSWGCSPRPTLSPWQKMHSLTSCYKCTLKNYLFFFFLNEGILPYQE